MSALTSFWRTLSPALRLNGLALLALVAFALLGPLFWNLNPTGMQISGRFAGPSLAHPLGQDEFGRDVLARLMHGARISLTVAGAAALIAAVIGTLAGLVGGYFGKFWEFITLRTADVVLAFPPILLALLVAALFGPSVTTLISVLAILYAPEFARIAYGETLSLRRMEYVEAMQALGARSPRILIRSILPNIGGPLLVQFSLTLSSAIIVEAGLSFLGLGIVPPTPSWGLMIRAARNYMEVNPGGLLAPSLCLVITIFFVNRFCDALQARFDPRSAARKLPKFFARPKSREATAAAALGRPAEADAPMLQIEDLRVQFATDRGVVTAVHDVSLDIRPGEILAVVGESGSGKSVTSLAITGLLPQRITRIDFGEIRFRTRNDRIVDTAALDAEGLRALRGAEISTVFQEPMTSLNPAYRIGEQLVETIFAHGETDRSKAEAKALEMLRLVGLSDPERRLRQYPHELSGGMRQRALIAIALVCEPQLLIADEPTTALDVTIQAEILQLIRDLQARSGHRMGVLFVTHNMGIVAQIADRVAVMYAGRIVESGPTLDIFERPRHPYTRRLLDCIPHPGRGRAQGARFTTIPGTVPSSFADVPGCAFAARCAVARPDCTTRLPPLVEAGSPAHRSRCLYWEAL